ncbi:MAG: efflux RND transporter periplasmic adaptor subunit [Sulfuritalea sp.]|nr:efflux RND transporter periplasmic adaptor subunit [Sulfuritalea sp.]
MSQSLYSTSWYRVADIKPRLRNHAQIHRHVYRGGVWYVLQNHSTGKFHRFTPVANLIIGLMDGRRSLQEIWDVACNRLGDEVPTQDEVIKLLSDLHRADVLQSDAPPDLHELQQRRKKHVRMRWKQYVGNPLSLRIPLFDPDRMLDRLMPLVKPLCNRYGAAVWLVVMGWALTLIAMHWKQLSGDLIDQVFSFQNLLLIWFVFPLIKLLHELGHAIATKVDGGEVHEMGVMLLVLMPIPYVDASSATAFRDKRSRVLVGAAGMLLELFIAALAVFAWVNLEPGTERAIAYNVIIVAGVSTLLFNANPLLRYDGYYILSDYLEIPNLAQRSNEYLGYLTNRYLFGIEGGKSPVEATGERGWFVFYAIGSFAYRMFMMVSIALLVASQFFFIGIVLAIWAFATMLVIPIGKKLQYLIAGPQLDAHRQRALVSTGLIVLLVTALLAWLPAPSSTRAQGVIWAPEEAQVRSTVDGFITRVVARPGQPVRRGDVLIECDDPELAARTSVLQAQLAELEARYNASIVSRRVQADMILEQKQHLIAALELADRRQAELQLRSPADGVFVMADVPNAPGKFTQRGEVLAYVMDGAATKVRVVVPQAEENLVSKRTRKVEIRPVGGIGQPITAQIRREVPAATDELPSMTLSLQGGGKIGLDPGKSGEGSKALEKLFVLDLDLVSGAPASYIGGRIHVRFEHQPEPLAEQWYRDVRRVFLKKFNV